MIPKTLGCLFSGVGNFERGLSVGGFDTLWQIEADPFRRRVLDARFGVECLSDVREATGLPKVDALCGGFPCQDLSSAGLGAGIRGERSSLWGEYARIVAEIEPAHVFIENVPLLLRRGFDVVVADLVELGYSIEWDCVPAAAVGAPHLRDRVWVVAHRASEPQVFGQPVGLFPEPPAELPGSEWSKWPRAGFVCGDPRAVLPLELTATVAMCKRGELWPTPQASSGGRRPPDGTTPSGHGPNGNKYQVGLNHYVKQVESGLWPTPMAADGERKSESHPRGNPTLLGAARHWPTPRASDADRGGRGDLVQAVRGNPNTHYSLWPTPHGMPKEGQHRRNGPSGNELGRAVNQAQADKPGGSLNPDWVEWLMGMPQGWTDPECPSSELQHIDWADEPLPRVARGVDDCNLRLAACGDSLVAQIPAAISGLLAVDEPTPQAS